MTSQPAPASPEIALLDLEKQFREVRAVDGVSLDIGAGEFFSLLGPSGCGKTTTLRMIGGFELPTGGTILLRGRDVTNDPPDKRPVNMVFQNYALFPHLNVGDNIAFGLKRRGVAKDETDAAGRRGARARPPRRLREAPAEPAVGRPAAARRARPGAGQPAERAAPRRAARRARPQAPPPAPGRAQAHPDRGRDHLRVRDPRPGGGAHDERPDRRHARGQGRAARHARGALRAPGDALRGRLHRLDEPAARAGRGRRLGPPRLGRRRRVAHDGIAPGTDVEISVRPEAIAIVPASAEGAIGATVEQVAYLGSTISYRRRTTGGLDLTVESPKTGVRLPVGSDVAVTWPPSEALVLGRGPVSTAEEEPA